MRILSGESPKRQLTVAAREPGVPDASYMPSNRGMPLWQLGERWFNQVDSFRWTQARAAAKLDRPGGAAAFELVADISPELPRGVGYTTVELWLDGESPGSRRFDAKGRRTARWVGAPAPASGVVEFQADTVVEGKSQ